jgi:hypothetical protein
LLPGLALLMRPRLAGGQPPSSTEVKAVVERLLAAAGSGDLDALSGMFAPGASIASASLRDGKWITGSQSFGVWLAMQRAMPR